MRGARRQVINGGNLRRDAKVTPSNVIGQVCPGDQVALLDRPAVSGWAAVRVAITGPDCDPKRVAAGTEGWVSTALLGPVAQVPATAPAATQQPQATVVPSPSPAARIPQSPSASPLMDGAQPIAYVAGGKGTFHIFRMNSDGSQPIRITQTTRGNNHPDWSPDGRRIAFNAGQDEASDIYVMDADGANVTRLTTDPDDEIFPVWSPDGRRIAYIGWGEYGPQLHLMNADGSHVVDTGVVMFDLFGWAPDGEQIVFSNGHDIFVMNVDTFAVRPLISTPFHDMEPSWSPDGRHIAFVSGEASLFNDGSQDIYVATPMVLISSTSPAARRTTVRLNGRPTVLS